MENLGCSHPTTRKPILNHCVSQSAKKAGCLDAMRYMGVHSQHAHAFGLNSKTLINLSPRVCDAVINDCEMPSPHVGMLFFPFICLVVHRSVFPFITKVHAPSPPRCGCGRVTTPSMVTHRLTCAGARNFNDNFELCVHPENRDLIRKG